MAKLKELWAWSYMRNRGGPFASRQEAIDDAKSKLGMVVFVNIGRVKHIDPVNFAGSLLVNDVLDSMNRLAELVHKTNTIRFTLQFGDDFHHDEKIKQIASDALDVLAKKWARKYVRTDAWVMERGEMVKI